MVTFLPPHPQELNSKTICVLFGGQGFMTLTTFLSFCNAVKSRLYAVVLLFFVIFF